MSIVQPDSRRSNPPNGPRPVIFRNYGTRSNPHVNAVQLHGRRLFQSTSCHDLDLSCLRNSLRRMRARKNMGRSGRSYEPVSSKSTMVMNDCPPRCN
jgi:hypothetical protein